MKTRDEYVNGLKQQLDRWNADMDRWEAQGKTAQAQAKQRCDDRLQDLREQREKVLYSLRLLEGASASAWQDFTKGADEAWARMSVALAEARSHFEKT